MKEESVKHSEYKESNLNSRIKISQVLSALWSSWWRLDKICISYILSVSGKFPPNLAFQTQISENLKHSQLVEFKTLIWILAEPGRPHCMMVKSMDFGARKKWVQVLVLRWIGFLKCLSLNNLVFPMGTVMHLLHLLSGASERMHACIALSKTLHGTTRYKLLIVIVLELGEALPV